MGLELFAELPLREFRLSGGLAGPGGAAAVDASPLWKNKFDFQHKISTKNQSFSFCF